MPNNLQELPGPSGLPLVGNLHQIPMKKIHERLASWADEYGSIYRFRMGPQKFVAVSSVEGIQQVLKDRPAYFRRMGSIEPVTAELKTAGLFSVEGESWKRQRALTMPAFNTAHLKNFFGSLRDITEKLRDFWMTGEERDVDTRKDLMRFAVDVTVQFAFGYEMNSLEDPDDKLQRELCQIFPAVGRRVTAPFPYWRYFKTKSDRQVDKSLAIVHETVQTLITQARERVEADPEIRENPRNFLEGLISSQSSNALLTDDEIFSNVMTILLAGQDTTANSMAWMLHLVSEHPEVQRKLQAEADAVLGADSVVTDYQTIATLSYAEAVVLESMRLKPVGPLLFLEANQDVKIGSTEVPNGTGVILLNGYCGLQESAFSSPLEFIPERWLPESTMKNHDPKAFLAFGGGPRFCPGRALALLEMKMVLAMVAKNFVLSSAADGSKPDDVFMFVVGPTNLWTNFRPR